MSQYLTSITLTNGDVTGGIFQAIAGVDVPLFTSTVQGVVPGSGGGTAHFLRADGIWATPSGGAVSSVSNTDTTLTISPTTGAVVASLNLASINVWTGAQFFTVTSPSAPFSSGARCERFGSTSGNNSASADGLTAFGNQALSSITSGNYNTAVGNFALTNATTSTQCTAVGYNAMQTTSSAATGCTAVGYTAIYNTNASFNTGIGALTASGISSTGTTLIGYGASVASDPSDYGIAIGYNAVCQANVASLSPRIVTFSLNTLSSTSTNRYMVDLGSQVVDNTDATRKYGGTLNSWDTVRRQAARWDADGTRAKLSIPVDSATAPTVYARLGGCLFDHYSDANNGTTVETDLYSDTLAANTFTANGDKVTYRAGGIFTGTGNSSQRIRAYFGGNLVFDTGAVAVGATTDWQFDLMVIMETTTTVRVIATLTGLTSTLLASDSQYTRVTGLTLSNSQILKITGTASGVGAASNQITATMASAFYFPAQ